MTERVTLKKCCMTGCEQNAVMRMQMYRPHRLGDAWVDSNLQYCVKHACEVLDRHINNGLHRRFRDLEDQRGS